MILNKRCVYCRSIIFCFHSGRIVGLYVFYLYLFIGSLLTSLLYRWTNWIFPTTTTESWMVEIVVIIKMSQIDNSATPPSSVSCVYVLCASCHWAVFYIYYTLWKKHTIHLFHIYTHPPTPRHVRSQRSIGTRDPLARRHH